MNDHGWHILGAGSLGIMWACRLARASVPARLVLRDREHLRAYQAEGYLTLSEAGQVSRWPLPAEASDATTPIRRLLVACKAYDAQPATAALASRLVTGADVVLLQNGLGSQDAVAASLPHVRCIYASSTEGALRPSRWHSQSTGQGSTWLGDPHDSTPVQWLAQLQASGINHEWTADIVTRQWQKLAINCAINPLTVLYDCRNGDLQDHAPEVAALCQELSDLLLHCAPPGATQDLHAQVQRVIAATAANYSSMHQDVAHRRRTEVSYLLGYACHRAAAGRIEIPRLRELLARLTDRLYQAGLPSD